MIPTLRSVHGLRESETIAPVEAAAILEARADLVAMTRVVAAAIREDVGRREFLRDVFEPAPRPASGCTQK